MVVGPVVLVGVMVGRLVGVVVVVLGKVMLEFATGKNDSEIITQKSQVFIMAL